MKTSKILLVQFLAASLLLTTEAASLQDINNKLTGDILSGEINVLDYATEALGNNPKSIDEAYRDFLIFIRAGMEDEAIDSARTIKKLVDENSASAFIDAVCTDINICKIITSGTAMSILEIFENSVTQYSDLERLVDKIIVDNATSGKANEWLLRRCESGNQQWTFVLNRFYIKNGNAAHVFPSIKRDILEHPGDTKPLISYLDARHFFWHNRRSGAISMLQVPETSWLVSALSPTNAIASAEVADILRNWGCMNEARFFYKKALNAEYSNAECTILDEQTFKRKVMQSIAGTLTSHEEQELSDAWRQKADGISVPKILHNDELIDAPGEPDDPDDMAAWLKYAVYAASMPENELETASHNIDNALRAALQYARTSTDRTESRDKDSAEIVGLIERFYISRRKFHEARNKLLSVLEKVDASDPTAIKAAECLASRRRGISHGEQRIWTWLYARQQWGKTEERLLQAMINDARQENRKDIILSVEAMSENADISRSYRLAKIADSIGAQEIALRLYDKCFNDSSDSMPKNEIAFERIRLLTHAGRWKEAESCYEQVKTLISRKNSVIEILAGISVLAAEDGNTEHAINMWKQVTTANILYTEGLDRIKKTDAKKTFIDYYTDLAIKAPTSSAPKTALFILNCTE